MPSLCRTLPLLAAGLLLTSSARLSAQDWALLPGAAALRYHACKPSRAELKWQQVPWLRDLAEARKLARAEKRPLLVWVSIYEPLERC
jgi:hypothetical protein